MTFHNVWFIIKQAQSLLKHHQCWQLRSININPPFIFSTLLYVLTIWLPALCLHALRRQPTPSMKKELSNVLTGGNQVNTKIDDFLNTFRGHLKSLCSDFRWNLFHTFLKLDGVTVKIWMFMSTIISLLTITGNLAKRQKCIPCHLLMKMLAQKLECVSIYMWAPERENVVAWVKKKQLEQQWSVKQLYNHLVCQIIIERKKVVTQSSEDLNQVLFEDGIKVAIGLLWTTGDRWMSTNCPAWSS